MDFNLVGDVLFTFLLCLQCKGDNQSLDVMTKRVKTK